MCVSSSFNSVGPSFHQIIQLLSALVLLLHFFISLTAVLQRGTFCVSVVAVGAHASRHHLHHDHHHDHHHSHHAGFAHSITRHSAVGHPYDVGADVAVDELWR
jgi:hypothetical protein